jgi:disulfide bond formation protein DsbB
MTITATLIERSRGNPAASAAFVIFLGAAGTLCGAWFFQYVLKLPPCPICLDERIPYYIGIPLALLTAIAAQRRAPGRLVPVGLAVLLLAFLWNTGLSAYHAGVEWHWWPGPTDCSGPISDFTAKGPLINQLQSVQLVRCDAAAWRLFGISLAGYDALVSLALAAIAALGLRFAKASA